jgi:hypothetical protein
MSLEVDSSHTSDMETHAVGQASTFRAQQRARLTCTECFRRKVKCDKNIPCGACKKRGCERFCTKSDPGATFMAPMIHQNSNEVESSVPKRMSQGDTPALVTESDSATVLEFLAWGRRKDNDFHNAPENQSGPRRHSAGEELPSIHRHLAEAIEAPQIGLLEALLPDEGLLRQLCEYHSSTLLWYHGSYNSYTFARNLDSFYAEHDGDLSHKEINLQWVALLFAILTGSLTCASTSTASRWGFDQRERMRLSKQWYQATVNCLNLSNYIENHTIYAVSAISSLTISAHILGLSNSQSVLLAAATRIAQSLGLHRLGIEPNSFEGSQVNNNRLRQRETGRRLWCQLCMSLWLHFFLPLELTRF